MTVIEDALLKYPPILIGWRLPNGEIRLGRDSQADGSHAVYVIENLPEVDFFGLMLATLKNEREAIATADTPCRRCGHPVIEIDEGHWRHAVNGAVSNAGCRAASFDRQGDWDDSMDRRWKASPNPGRS